ncbi:MAG: flagellar motor protein MotB [Elusimicrobia bacterium]|nr:flagellar motor protein MotB [Elusimicrobiota bacterium]
MALRAPKGFIDETDPKVCQIGHPAPAWLVNYADLMTELVCFFVILYALSAALSKDMQKANQDIQEMMKEEQIAGKTEMTKDGLKITFQEQGKMTQFDSGFAELTPAMKDVIDRVAPQLRELTLKGHEVIVEGHTDNVPIHNDYFWSNWELSSARATTVVEYLIREKGFPPGCVAATGYGDTRPILPNDSPEHKAGNRRVVFFVKNPPMKANRCDPSLPASHPEPRPPRPAAEPGEPQEASG